MRLRWIKLGALAVSAVVVAGMVLKEKLESAVSEAPPDAPDSDRQQSPEQIISDGILAHAPVFDGLYESLFQAGRDQANFSTEAYEEWCERMERIGDEALQLAFAGRFPRQDAADEGLCRAHFDALLECIDRAGIVRERDNGCRCIADEALCWAYLAADGGPIQAGAEYTVLKSAWVLGDKVIEYGMVMGCAAG